MAPEFADLIESIYASVSNPSHWQKFLAELAAAVRADRGSIALRVSRDPEFAIVAFYGWSAKEIQTYQEEWAATDPWGVTSAQWPEGRVGTDAEVCPRERMEASLAFKHFYVPHDALYGMGGTILVTETGQSVVALARGADAGPFVETELAKLRALMPHLKRAALLSGELGALRSQLSSLTLYLDRFPHPFFLIDPMRRVLFLNTSARSVTDANDGIAIDRGELRLQDPATARRFQEDVTQLASSRGSEVRILKIPRPSSRPPFRLLAMPIADSGVLALGVAQPCVAVIIVDAELTHDPDPATLRKLFSLTPAEARVAIRLMRGETPQEIADNSGASILTIRSHIKRILAKTDTQRQAELIALIVRSWPLP